MKRDMGKDMMKRKEEKEFARDQQENCERVKENIRTLSLIKDRPRKID